MVNHIFDIRLAGKKIRIQSLYSYIFEYCKDYLDEKKESEQFDFAIEVKKEDIIQERKKSESEDLKEGIPIRHFSDEYLETLVVYRKIAEKMIDYNTLLFHSSVIAIDGIGYCFTAKSGTGKSTHTKLWRKKFGERATMVNDDKPLLKVTEEGVIAYGTPWDGKHRLSSNVAVKLKAICILNRDETNHIEYMSGRDAYPFLLQQTYRSEDPVKLVQTLKLLDRMIKNTEIYSLGCNMKPDAAVVAFNGMQ